MLLVWVKKQHSTRCLVITYLSERTKSNLEILTRSSAHKLCY